MRGDLPIFAATASTNRIIQSRRAPRLRRAVDVFALKIDDLRLRAC
jgi:hypothetical protein